MFRKITRVAATLLFLTGLAVFLYPVAAQILTSWEEKKGIEDYETYLSDASGEPQNGTETVFPELLKEMETYNREIYENGQSGLKDPFSYEEPSFDLKKWGMEEEMFGYLIIPEMNLELPLYLGASKENMNKGAVHMSQTSLPVGGENTNAVIAAHRGRYSAGMFREIEKLEPGDEVTIRNPWGRISYRVTSYMVVEPDETGKVLIQEGRDMVTLVTCHPYPVNNQRYLVYCERVTEEKEGKSGEALPESPEETGQTEETKGYFSGKYSVVDLELGIRILCACVLAVVAVCKIFGRKKRP